MEASTSIGRKLEELFAAERQVRNCHGELAELDQAPLVAHLNSAVAQTLTLDDEDERALRLVRISALLEELEGPKVVDLLMDILGSEDPEARHAAGTALEGHAFDRFKEVALGVERALERWPDGSLALEELPYILLEVGEPGVLKLLGRFLAHKDPRAVASAIEALVELGDPAALPLVASLEKDKREVSLEDEEGGEEGHVTIGELAQEAHEILSAAEAPAEFVEPRGKGKGR